MSDLLLYDHKSSICSQMARLALVEKGCVFKRRQIDIMETNEQFEPWYVALNPRAVVPTLQIGQETVTDTISIVNRVQALPGADLSGDATTQDWLRDIMALHYGVLMYRKRLDPDGTAPQIVARGHFLELLRQQHPDMQSLIEGRVDGNRRFQVLLKDPVAIAQHVAAARALIGRMAQTLRARTYLAGAAYSLADCFATAALARFTIHGLAESWAGTALSDYYSRMKSRPSYVNAQIIDTGSERDL